MLREVAVVGHRGGGEIGTVVSLPISTLFIMTHNAVELDFAFLKAKLYTCHAFVFNRRGRIIVVGSLKADLIYAG